MIYELLANNPIAFFIGNWPIRWYGLILTTGMLCAFIFLLYNGGKIYGDTDFLYEVFIYAILFAIIGARFVYVIVRPDEYFPIKNFDDFVNMWAIWKGGVTIIGGVIFGALGVGLCAKRNKRSTLKIYDTIVPSLFIGQIIGRWGNFVNQEAYGITINNPDFQKFPFAVFIESENAWCAATFFYEMLLNIIGLTIVLYLRFNKKPRRGVLSLIYFAWYGIVRSIMEFVRTDAVIIEFENGGFLRLTQLFCVIVAIVCIALIVLVQKGIINTEKYVEKFAKGLCDDNALIQAEIDAYMDELLK